MKQYQDQVKEFMLKAGQDCPDKPIIPSAEVIDLRLSLHMEECYWELGAAYSNGDIAEIADSIADGLVVLLGTAVACGINIEPVFDEVMRSNMTKFIDGHRRSDGEMDKRPKLFPCANCADNSIPNGVTCMLPNYEPDWKLISHLNWNLLLLSISFLLVSIGFRNWRK